jgi:hypothetical protein
VPEVRHSEPAASAVVHEHNVKLSAFSRPGEVRRILGKRRTHGASRKQTKENAHVFHSRNELLNTDARDVQGRNGGAYIGIALVCADYECSRLGDSEVPARHSRSGSQETRASVVAHGLGEEMWIVVIRVGPNFPREDPCNVMPCLVNGGNYDVAWGLPVELLDALAEIGFGYPNSPVFKEVRHSAFFLEHGLALDQLCHAPLAKNGVHDVVVFGCVQGPMNLGAAHAGVACEFFEVAVEVGESVFLYLRRDRSQLLPLRNGGRRLIPAGHNRPQKSIVHRLMHLILQDE